VLVICHCACGETWKIPSQNGNMRKTDVEIIAFGNHSWSLYRGHLPRNYQKLPVISIALVITGNFHFCKSGKLLKIPSLCIKVYNTQEINNFQKFPVQMAIRIFLLVYT
jgi:hypothetical protein